jgi:hypothetical protein
VLLDPFPAFFWNPTHNPGQFIARARCLDRRNG